MDKFISENLLTAEEVSGVLRIPLPTIYRLTQQSKIKAVKIGKHWRYKKEDIERYLRFGTDFAECGFNERRAYCRINTNFRCSYLVDLPPFKIINSEGIIKNLSAGGVFIVGGGVEIDDPVDLNFIVENTEISAKGKVVRKTEEGLAVKFKSINREMQNRILEYAV